MGRCVIFTRLMMLLLMIIRFTEGIWLNLPSTGTKCVSEEILNNVVVVADYVIIDEQGHASPTVSAKVASPYGNNLYHKENVTHDLVNNWNQRSHGGIACRIDVSIIGQIGSDSFYCHKGPIKIKDAEAQAYV